MLSFFTPLTVNNYASLFNCTPTGLASDSMMAPTYAEDGAFSTVDWPTGVQLVILFCLRFSLVLFDFPDISSCPATRWTIDSSSLNLLGTFRDFLFYRDNSLTS